MFLASIKIDGFLRLMEINVLVAPPKFRRQVYDGDNGKRTLSVMISGGRLWRSNQNNLSPLTLETHLY